jgi:hypothetical protein
LGVFADCTRAELEAFDLVSETCVLEAQMPLKKEFIPAAFML